MGKKAVDVALLPSEQMAEKVICANRELVERFGSKIILNKQNCLPHISLAMGCIDDGDIPDIARILTVIADKHPLGNLKAVGIGVETGSTGEKVSAFGIQKTRKLQLLHEEIMNQLGPYMSSDASADMLYPSGEITASTLLWIKYYREKAAFKHFLPHITIGYGEPDAVDLPTEFAVSELAICHLGNHCTCRKILASVWLKTDAHP
jgi:2'-5' RNA ligase